MNRFLITMLTMILFAGCSSSRIGQRKDFSFLNGDWTNPCDSILTGNYKGVECDVDYSDRPITNFTIVRNKGTMTLSNRYAKKVLNVEFVSKDDVLYLESDSKGTKEKLEIFKMDSITFKIYNADKTIIDLYERKQQ